MLQNNDIVPVTLTKDEFDQCVVTALEISHSIVDRHDLNGRDHLDRFINLLQGECAEHAVRSYFNSHEIAAVSPDKLARRGPDKGIDLYLPAPNRSKPLICSVKSSTSYAFSPPALLDEMTLASTPKEVRDINIQVMFWLELKKRPRQVVPSLRNAAVIGWFTPDQLTTFAPYSTQRREQSQIPLRQAHSMAELVKLLRSPGVEKKVSSLSDDEWLETIA